MHRRQYIAIAVASILAVSCVYAASALAEAFLSAKYPAVIKGKQESGEGQAFGLEGLTVSCKAASFTSEELYDGVEEIEVTPSYSECTASGSAATVASEGCVFRLKANEAKMDIVCPEAKTMKITAVLGACQATIGSQSGIGTAEVSNKETSPTTVSASISVSGLTYTKTKDGIGCPFSGTGARENGTLTTSAVLESIAFGAQDGFSVGEAIPTVLCEASETPCKKPYGKVAFEAEAATNPVFEYIYSGVNTKVECFESKFEGKITGPGNATLSGSVTSFSFTKCNATNCTVSVGANLPYTSGFLGTLALGAGNGTFWIERRAVNKEPLYEVNCGQETCKFSNASLGAVVTGGSPATMETTGPTIPRIAGNPAQCESSLTFKKTIYKFTAPTSGGTAKMWLTP